MTKTENQLNTGIFRSTFFIIPLAVLILNDFLFKTHFPGAVTGKLSDITGIWVLALTLLAFFPNRKNVVYISVSLFFLLWKSPFSQLMIDGWNALPLFTIGRVVDYSDLLALAVLPLSGYVADAKPWLITKLNPVIPFVVAMFAFSATSKVKRISYDDNGYIFDFPVEELVERMNRLSADDSMSMNIPLSVHGQNANDTLVFMYDSLPCYVSRYEDRYDTIFKRNSSEIDTVFHFSVPVCDTMYMDDGGIVWYYINFDQAADDCTSIPVKLWINRSSDNRSRIALKDIVIINCNTFYHSSDEEKAAFKKAFEADFIEKLR